jgi:hypothetical protein
MDLTVVAGSTRYVVFSFRFLVFLMMYIYIYTPEEGFDQLRSPPVVADDLCIRVYSILECDE